MAHGQRLQQSKILQLVVDYVRSSQQGKEMSRGTGKKGKGNLYFIGSRWLNMNTIHRNIPGKLVTIEWMNILSLPSH